MRRLCLVKTPLQESVGGHHFHHTCRHGISTGLQKIKGSRCSLDGFYKENAEALRIVLYLGDIVREPLYNFRQCRNKVLGERKLPTRYGLSHVLHLKYIVLHGGHIVLREDDARPPCAFGEFGILLCRHGEQRHQLFGCSHKELSCDGELFCLCGGFLYFRADLPEHVGERLHRTIRVLDLYVELLEHISGLAGGGCNKIMDVLQPAHFAG